jgi:hypothetical protein
LELNGELKKLLRGEMTDEQPTHKLRNRCWFVVAVTRNLINFGPKIKGPLRAMAKAI